jgi:hypothetical protein
MEATQDYSSQENQGQGPVRRLERHCGDGPANDPLALAPKADDFLRGFSAAPLRRTRLAQLLWMPLKNMQLRVRILG